MEHKASMKWCEEADVGHPASKSVTALTYMYTKVIHTGTLQDYKYTFLLKDCNYNLVLWYTCMCMAMVRWQMLWALWRQIYKIWIRVANRFELWFSDRYTFLHLGSAQSGLAWNTTATRWCKEADDKMTSRNQRVMHLSFVRRTSWPPGMVRHCTDVSRTFWYHDAPSVTESDTPLHSIDAHLSQTYDTPFHEND